MDRYVRQLQEANEKLRVAEDALHKQMSNSCLYLSLNSILISVDFVTVHSLFIYESMVVKLFFYLVSFSHELSKEKR